MPTLTIGAEHPALAGHFPGTPIVPGVVLLDETLRAVEQDVGAAATRWRISTAKFLQPRASGRRVDTRARATRRRLAAVHGFKGRAAGRPRRVGSRGAKASGLAR